LSTQVFTHFQYLYFSHYPLNTSIC